MNIRVTSLLTALLGAVLVACGSGGDSGSASTVGGGPAAGSGSSSSAASAASAPAGLSSTGTISAFGSVFINGNHFSVSGAQITIDDDPVTEQDLRVGHTATVTGTAAVGAGLATATLVAVRSQVVGAVASVNAAGSSFVVLGQTVKVNSDTSFGTVITPADITGIRAGDLVAVFGPVAADGSITARRIDRAPAAMGLRVAGTLSSVNTTARTFKINSLTVDYSAATLLGYSGSVPANGDVVQVRGTVVNATTGALTATSVARPARPSASAPSAIVEFEGLVTRFASLTDFDIGGQKVTTTSATQYVNGSSADIALNANVEARGTINSAGVLVASVIDAHNNSHLALNATITALNSSAGTITVLGTTVVINTLTRLEDLGATRIRNFAFGDLRIGDNVMVVGYEKPAGQVTATLLTRLPVATGITVSGPFTAATAPQFKVLGVTVNAASATFYADRNATLTSAAFFSQAAGRQVVVTGTAGATAGTVNATRVMLLPVDIF